jgi:hypothetical protein
MSQEMDAEAQELRLAMAQSLAEAEMEKQRAKVSACMSCTAELIHVSIRVSSCCTVVQFPHQVGTCSQAVREVDIKPAGQL